MEGMSIYGKLRVVALSNQELENIKIIIAVIIEWITTNHRYVVIIPRTRSFI